MRSIIKNNLNIYIVGIGCCKHEIFATRGPVYDISRFGINFVSSPEDADVFVFEGFRNSQLLTRAIEVYEMMQEPKWAIAVGKCALETCKYKGEDILVKKFRSKVKFDVYLPGCPPRPEAFIYAIIRLLDKI